MDNLKLFTSAVRAGMSSAILRKLLQDIELLEPDTSNDIEESDLSDNFEEHQEIHVVNENEWRHLEVGSSYL